MSGIEYRLAQKSLDTIGKVLEHGESRNVCARIYVIEF